MNPILKLYLITRPVQFVAAGLGAWVVAVICNGPDPFSPNKIAVGVAMAINCLAASVFHYGAADYMYRRKTEAAPVKNPKALVILGLMGFAFSLALAYAYLSARVLGLFVGNVGLLLLYPRVLSRIWWTKTLPIAYVCTTPILSGWWAGTHTNPILPFVVPAIFFLYAAREIIKDIHDRVTNHEAGRVTMPLEFGIKPAMKVAGTLVVFGVGFLIVLISKPNLPAVPTALVAVSLAAFGMAARQLLFANVPGRTHQQITVGVYSLIGAVMTLGIGK